MKLGLDKGMALIVVDVQNDFIPGGALPVPKGNKVVAVLNEYIREFITNGAPIFYTRDWHPRNHISFKERGGIWPPHCIENTKGARFHPNLIVPERARIISKATGPDEEAYSGFQGTELASELRKLRVRRVLVGGLATDYCVKNTALDALKAGFKTYVLTDACRGVEVNPGDSKRAIQEMLAKGAEKLDLTQLVSAPKIVSKS